MTHFVSKTTLTTFSIMSFSKTFPEVFFQQSKLYVLNFGVFFSHAFQLHFRSWVLFSCQVCTLSCWQGRDWGNGTLKGVICKRDIFSDDQFESTEMALLDISREKILSLWQFQRRRYPFIIYLFFVKEKKWRFFGAKSFKIISIKMVWK